MSDTAGREEFADFVRVNWTSLMRIGIAVSGSRVEAEDLVQGALTAAYPRWHRIRPDQALAYLRRSIMNAHISRWRRDRRVRVVLAAPRARERTGRPDERRARPADAGLHARSPAHFGDGALHPDPLDRARRVGHNFRAGHVVQRRQEQRSDL